MRHQNVLRSTLQVLCSMVVLFAVLIFPQHLFAANGINKVINFQGKVTNSNGTNVNDGTYDFVIKIYDGAGSGASTLFTESWTSSALWSSTMSSAPSSGGESLTYSTETNESSIKVGQILWNTTKQESVVVTSINTGTNVIGISPTRQAWSGSDTVINKIYVKDGVFKVAINSLNQNLSGVNFGTDSIFVGITFHTDSEMKPRIQYTSTPYAFNSEKVNGLTVTNTSDAAFSSATTLKIGDGKTVQIDNGIRFTGTDGTQFTFPNATGTVATLDASQVLTNKSIGSTGLTFSGATTDITTGTNEDFVLSPNGTGKIGLGNTAPVSYLDVMGQVKGKALFSLNETGDQNILTASSSGTTRFSIGNTGILTLASGETVDNTSVDNTLILASNATNGAGVVRLPVKTSSGDPSLNVGGNMYYNQSSGKFRCYQNTGWVDCIPSSNLQSSSNTTPNTLASGSETSIVSATITPSTTTSQIWIVSTVEVRGDGNTNRNVTLTVKRGASCAAGSTIGTSMVVETDYAADNYAGALNFVDVPGNTSSQTYHICATTDAGSPTTNAQNITLYEPNGGAVTAGSLTVRESDSSPAVTSVATLEFGPTTTSTDEFILSDQTGGVARVRIGNQVGMLNQNEAITGNWNITGSTFGIGTTTPLAKLHVVGGNDPTASISAVSAFAGLVVDNTVGDLFTASSSGLNRFVIKQNGNVGIGTSNPLAQFQINKDSTETSILGLFNNPSDDPGAIAAIDLNVGTVGSTTWRIQGTQSLLQLGSSVFNPPTLNISGSGIGILTTTPRAALDVNGAASISGALRFYSGDASIQATQNSNLFIGSTAGSNSTTGNVLITPLGNVGIGTTAPLASLHLLGSFGTGATASISARGSFAGLVVNNTVGDLFTASSSGLPRFTVKQDGSLIASAYSTNGGVLYTNGSGLISQTAGGTGAQCLKGDLTWGTCGGAAGTNYWQIAPLGGAISPYIDSYDVLVGSTATSSALVRLAGTSGQSSFFNGGNLGIGTTAPVGLLSVNGKVTGRALSLFNETGDQDIFTASASGETRFRVGNNGDLSLLGTGAVRLGFYPLSDVSSLNPGSTSTGSVIEGPGQRHLIFDLRNNDARDSIAFRYSSNDSQIVNTIGFVMNGRGNVGIGTKNPDGKLNVEGDSGGKALVTFNELGTNDIFTASVAGATKVVINNSGFLGIGITSPSRPLHVYYNNGNTQTGQAYIEQAGAGDAILHMGLTGGVHYTFGIDNSDSDKFKIGYSATLPEGADQNTRFTLDTNGNVGIGTTAPTGLLNIEGKVKGKALSLFNETGDQDILAASASGVSKFTVSRTGSASMSGGLTLGDGTAANNTIKTAYGPLGLQYKSGANAWSTGLTMVDGTGYIGIGTTNPTTGKLVISDGGAAPTVDLQQISASTGITTDGVDGLQIDVANSGSNANTNSGLTINVTSNNTNASAILYGLNVANLSSGGENASEIALNIGTGWDKGIVIASGGSTNSGLSYTGAGRPTKTITLSPEFAGAILTASGSATTNGSMTSDASPSAALSNYTTYYQWTSTQTSLQDYTVAVRVTLPQDFSAWTTNNALQVNYNTALTTSDTNKLDVFVYNGDTGLSAQNAATPVGYYQANRSASAKTWTTLTIDDSDLTDGGNAVTAAGKTITIYLKMYAKDNNYVQVGDIILNYLASF